MRRHPHGHRQVRERNLQPRRRRGGPRLPHAQPRREVADLGRHLLISLLRPVAQSDVATFYEHHLDDQSRAQIGWPGEPPQERAAFFAKWERILNPAGGGLSRTLVADGRVAGFFVSFVRHGLRECGYALGREFWGRGLATAGLREFLSWETTRPLYGRTSKTNVASTRVLQKCGFAIIGSDRWRPEHPDAPELEDWVLVLR